jgi:AmmeMemoRadiSam system protein A
MKWLILAVVLVCSVWSSKANSASKILSEREKAFLVDLARRTLSDTIRYGTIPAMDAETATEGISKKLACFVTLDKRRTGLRGCIGMFEARDPLYANVISRTIAAATGDPRFPKVKPDELGDIKIEISVLTTPEDLAFESVEDLLDKLVPLRDGVIITTRYGSSTFLPQVWEQLSDKEEFLGHLCRKHGAPDREWAKGPEGVRIQIYHAEVFGEEAFGRIVVGPEGARAGAGGAVIVGPVILTDETPPGTERKVAPGTELPPGTILTSDSEIARP